MKTSIIVTSYNQAPTLELLFESLKRQTEKGFEVLIADDGSSDSTKSLCSKDWGFVVKFVTQKDDGYRKSKIVNEAIRNSRTPYIIFLDGDVVLEKHFVEDHLSLRKPGSFVCGRRVDLGPKFSVAVNSNYVRSGCLDYPNLGLFQSVMTGDSLHFNRSIRVTNKIIRKIFKYDKPLDILGSNFSLWREDLEKVNGFNEELEAYWGEDGDLFIRLRNCGLKNIGAIAKCVQFHIFHKRRQPTKENEERFYRLLKDFEYKWATKGLKQT